MLWWPLGLEVKESVQAAKTSLPELATKAAEAGSSAQQQFETRSEPIAAFAQIGENIERLGSNVLKSTTELLSSVSEAIDLVEDDASPARSKHRRPLSLEGAAGVAKYNRFEAQACATRRPGLKCSPLTMFTCVLQVAAMQRDSSTYCDEPEDEEDFQAWQEEFKLDDRQAKIDKLVNENAFMQELQSRIVPDIVDYETFWLRYFYRLHKLQQVQEAREDLVKRATLPEEELSWDVDESPVGKPEVNSESHDVLGTADVSGEAARKGEGSGDRLDGEQVQYGSCLGHAHEAEETYTTPGDVVPEVPEESGDVDGDLAAPAEPPAGGQEAEDQTVRSEASASSSDWTMVSEGTTKASVVSLETEGESIGNESAVEVEHKDGKASDVDEDWGNWE
eukprot:scaffold2756_cov376-Prasinococcus_capsulatus_cf.AAC.5